jgi:hypothetical protein
MATREELLNRRVGRMEALASDLAELPPGYQPTELEMVRAAELRAYLALIRGPEPAAEPALAEIINEGRKPKIGK